MRCEPEADTIETWHGYGRTIFFPTQMWKPT